MSRIALESITKRYQDGTTAVRSLDLSIADGELMVLVGPSGCGKTTALRMVAGLEEITEGTILIDGQPVNDMEPRDRDIAMVFQSYALYPHLTVRDNMAFSLKYRKTPKQEIRRRVDEAARILELEELLGRKPRQLSGGQRQRVAMGRAIVRQPRAFLMDEPLSNLDAKLRVQMRAEIARLQRSLGVTTIYVTHDQTEAMTLGSRVAVLRHGVLQQVAAPQELYRRPANLFVAGFIGSPAMNLIEATLERGADDSGPGGPEVIFGAHRLRVPPGVVRQHGALEKYLGRTVVVGIRPENLEDAALVPGRGAGVRARGVGRAARGARRGGQRALHGGRAAAPGGRGGHRGQRAGRGRDRGGPADPGDHRPAGPQDRDPRGRAGPDPRGPGLTAFLRPRHRRQSPGLARAPAPTPRSGPAAAPQRLTPRARSRARSTAP